MNTQRTVADVRSLLSYIVNPSNPNDPRFLNFLNEICERYTYSGKWKGALVTTTYDSADNFITLPPDYLSVLNMTYDKVPVPVFMQFHQYMEGGPGEVDDTLAFPYMLTDMGDGFPTQSDIDAVGPIRVYSSAADNAAVVRIYGISATTGNPVYDSSGDEGENVTLAAPFALTTNSYSRITGFTKPATNNWVSLKVLPTDASAEYQIATYRPSETRPAYRRYQTAQATEAIKCICQRRFMPMAAETDWVIPGSLSALRAGLQMMLYEEADDMESAEKAFARGLNFLNQEAKATRGGGRPPLAIETWGFNTTTPWTN